MSQIFKQNEDYARKPQRNNFDLSFDNNFTTGFGKIVPLLCKEVNPGDTFRIKSSIGLRALPLAFPLQTPVRVQVSFFYQRLRNLQTNFMDFYSQTKDIEIPYISIPASRAGEIGTGTLADYLGVPTTYADEEGYDYISFNPVPLSYTSLRDDHSVFEGTSTSTTEDLVTNATFNANLSSLSNGSYFSVLYPNLSWGSQFYDSFPLSYFLNANTVLSSSTIGDYYIGNVFGSNSFLLGGDIRFFIDSVTQPVDYILYISCPSDTSDDFNDSHIVYHTSGQTSYDASLDSHIISFSDVDAVNSLINGRKFWITLGFETLDIYKSFSSLIVKRHYVSSADVSSANNPFVIQPNETVPDIKLAAYPFRCYESIYNAYYRNSNGVDPFILDGVEEFNRYCTNLGDGADSTTPLNLRYRNYELDFLTSCYKSPQLGDAALVGVSSTGKFTFEDANGQVYTVTPVIGDDGNTLTGIDSYSEGTPIGSLTRLRDLISYGISINDFRNVSHFQNFMENAMRRGLRYAEVLKSHTGVNIKYKSVDLPEYIGGYTRNLNVRQITSTAQTEEMNLGDYSGQAGIFSSSEHSITHYCDEPGFIVCMLTIVPIPCYSQILDKKFIKDNLLSWHFPEFNGIGLQPIDYREVTPIQRKVEGLPYTSTFGYQRPWYDLIASYDEVHGLFRTDLQGFLITRNFTHSPNLNANFLHINPDEMTNPFIDTSSSDHTFMGQIHFDIKAKRAIPRIHIPTIS